MLCCMTGNFCNTWDGQCTSWNDFKQNKCNGNYKIKAFSTDLSLVHFDETRIYFEPFWNGTDVPQLI